MHDVLHPRREYDGEAGAVGDVVDTADLMLDVVRGPVANAPGVEQVVVGDGTGPHELSPGVVIVRIFQDQRRLPHDGLERTFDQAVGETDVLDVGEIALHQVRRNIHGTAGNLELGQGEGEFWVEDGKARVDQLRIDGTLEPAFFLGNDGAGTRLATGSRQGEDSADRQGGGRRAFAQIEIPDVAFNDGAHGDRLRRVDDAAAAHGENKAELVFLAELDAFMHEAQARIGLDAAEFDPLDASRLERGGDAVIKAARLDAAAAEMQQRLLAVCRRVLADLGLGTATKNDAGGIAEFKIVHASILLCLLPF